MKITLFTGNQVRHQFMINALKDVSDELYVIQECKTVFPGYVEDVASRRSDAQRDYFDKMRTAEKKVFGELSFLEGIKNVSLKNGDLTYWNPEDLGDASESDCFIVFGASFIKGELLHFLVEKNTLNVHVGVSPYYKGSACNFWAMYDHKPQYVGATIHLLSEKLDGGPILYHALPAAESYDSFEIGMRAVQAAVISLKEKIKDNSLDISMAVPQAECAMGKISRRREFDDNIIYQYYSKILSPNRIKEILLTRDVNDYVSPWIMKTE